VLSGLMQSSETDSTWGLGILDLKLLVIALQLRWLWLHHDSRSWSAMPIQVDQTSQVLFKALVKHVLGMKKQFYSGLILGSLVVVF
jgi:hypothetical protein